MKKVLFSSLAVMALAIGLIAPTTQAAQAAGCGCGMAGCQAKVSATGAKTCGCAGTEAGKACGCGGTNAAKGCGCGKASAKKTPAKTLGLNLKNLLARK